MMNKLFLFLLIMIIFSSSLVSADSISVDSGSGLNLVIGVVSDGDIGFFGQIPGPVLAALGGSGYSSEYYDVIVNVIKDVHYPERVVTANISLFNKGDVPDRDSVLKYYLITPNGSKILSSVEQFEEIAPGEHHLIRRITLPADTVLGEWWFVAEYTTNFQPLIVVHDSFQVIVLPWYKKYWYLLLIAFLVLLRSIKQYIHSTD